MGTYFCIYLFIAIWVFLDAKKRRINGFVWAVITVIFGPIVIPFYLAKRPLKEGEIREGGMAWNLLKYFAMFWTLTLFVLFVAGVTSVVSHTEQNSISEAEKAGVGFGMAVGGMMFFVLWFFVVVGALVLGLFLKKSSLVERGPTGPLAPNDAKTHETNLPLISSSREWFYSDSNNQPVGPVSISELQILAVSGDVTSDTFVIKEGDSKWQPYGSMKSL